MVQHGGSKKIEICHGINCRDYGGKALAEKLMEGGIAFNTSACRSLCPYAPVVFVDGKLCLDMAVDDWVRPDEEVQRGIADK